MEQREFFIIILITFFVFVVWIVSDIIHTRPSTPIDAKLSKILEPINPNFDSSTLKLIHDINYINAQPIELPKPSPSPSPSPRRPQQATSSARL